MSYSSIVRKKCKCSPDCKLWPSLGYAGYAMSHAPQELKDKVGTKQQVAVRNRNKRNAISRKLHQTSDEVAQNRNNMDLWFSLIRTKLTGTCQCGCGQPSSKKDDTYYRHSCCHLFPKNRFDSIKTHPLNFVERAFFGGCHSIFDDTSMDRWVNMADWEDIKAKFYELAPLLTQEERANKFYTHLEKLVFLN
jgi:hypothetical protein